MTVELPIASDCPVAGEVIDMVEAADTEAVLAVALLAAQVKPVGQAVEAVVTVVAAVAQDFWLIAVRVNGPVCPVAVMPLAVWKAFKAALVWEPKYPVAEDER
jgi:hypothetical protein